MTFDQWMQLLPIGISVVSLAVLIGMWRSRQEAADRAAEQAITNAGVVYGLRITNLETKLEAQAAQTALQVRAVDRDVAALKESIGELKSRMQGSEAERREEFQRLHKIGNDTHALIVRHLTELQRVFVPREEYESTRAETQRRLERLEENGGGQ